MVAVVILSVELVLSSHGKTKTNDPSGHYKNTDGLQSQTCRRRTFTHLEAVCRRIRKRIKGFKIKKDSKH